MELLAKKDILALLGVRLMDTRQLGMGTHRQALSGRALYPFSCQELSFQEWFTVEESHVRPCFQDQAATVNLDVKPCRIQSTASHELDSLPSTEDNSETRLWLGVRLCHSDRTSRESAQEVQNSTECLPLWQRRHHRLAVDVQVATAPNPLKLPASLLTHLQSRLPGSLVFWLTEGVAIVCGLGAQGLRLSTYPFFLHKYLQRNGEVTGHKPVIPLGNRLWCFMEYLGKYICRMSTASCYGDSLRTLLGKSPSQTESIAAPASSPRGTSLCRHSLSISQLWINPGTCFVWREVDGIAW